MRSEKEIELLVEFAKLAQRCTVLHMDKIRERYRHLCRQVTATQADDMEPMT
jgi:hypothetical protein